MFELKTINEINAMIDNIEDKGQVSDGSHTFNELYYHRMVLFSVICNSHKDVCYKSKLHDDGTMYPGYFIVGVKTPEGDYSYHYELKYWDMFEVTELERAPKWDGHKPEDVTRLMSLLGPKYDDWVRMEIDLACGNEDEYGKAIYNSAAKAYMSLREDGHTGFSIGITKQILNRMIEHKPLTPLTGADDEWSECVERNDEKGYICYQNKRYSALFKYVYDNGEIQYSDCDQFVCEYVNNPKMRFHAGYAKKYVEHLYPITMPYIPNNYPIVIYMDDFLFDPNMGDFDTVAIMYLEEPNGNKVDINVFLADKGGNTMVEISKEEYLERKANKVK